MPFLTQGKTNWKFIGIVVVLAIIVGGGIWWYQNSFEVDDKINSKPCVMWNLSQLREIAELHFITHNSNFFGFENNLQILDIKKEIERCGGSNLSINISFDGKKYCAEVLLPSAHDWFCVDSLGNLLTTSFTSNCSSDYFSCIEETENETASWQTYRNEEYGFEVEYPSFVDFPGRESFTVLPRKWEDLWLQDPLVEAVSFEGPRVEEWGERLPVELLVWKVRESEPCDSRQYSQLKKYTYGEIKKEEEFMSETSDANVWQISGIIPRGSDYSIDTYFSRKDCDLLTEDKHVIVIRQIGSSLDSFPFYSQMLSTFRFLE